MRQTAAVCAVLACLAAVAGADEIVMNKGLTYSSVMIFRVADSQITFRIAGGATVTKFLSNVRTIQVRGRDSFNQAEKLMAQKPPQAAAAVKAYDAVKHTEDRPWLKKLIRYREIRALDQAGLIARATQEWLAVMDQDSGSPAAAMLRPTRLGKKGSNRNARAIALLKTKFQQVRSNKAYWNAVGAMLMRLYRKEGMTQQADQLAGKIAGGPAAPAGTQPASGGTGSAGNGQAANAAALSAQIQAAKTLVRPDQDPADLRKARAAMEANLNRFSELQLPEALLLKGKAELYLADRASGDARTALLDEAGLSLMRVFTYFGQTSQAGEALYLAGKVNVDLGNVRAGRMAFQQVVGHYPGSQAARMAKVELAKLEGPAH